MARGRMPNFARLAAQGRFGPLATTIPPQSPVAWSSFITGRDPGAYGIFDFVHRDPKTMTPYLSTTRTEPGRWNLRLFGWQFPLRPGRVELLREGEPFWNELEARHIPTTIMRMPANFPPSGTATRELSGMGTPDILGTYGTFSFYTSDAASFPAGSPSGGAVYHVSVQDGVVHGTLDGPDQPFLTQPTAMHVPFTAEVDATREFVKIDVGAEERVLRVGQWSDWVPVSFAVKPFQTLPAEARFYVKALSPSFELYVSPLNFDPLSPANPISTPAGYAAELARATGRFYTQGMPEDTAALKSGVFDTDEFLRQAAIAQDETLREYRYVLSRFDRGLLFYYFGDTDQVSHMMWRTLDPGHPAYDADDAAHAHVIPDMYAAVDAIVGETLKQLGPDDLLVVMSDHGFASWRRSFNLNSWLRDHGYLSAPSGRPIRLLLERGLEDHARVRPRLERPVRQPARPRVDRHREPERPQRAARRADAATPRDRRPHHRAAGHHARLSQRQGLLARTRGHRARPHHRLRQGHAGVGRLGHRRAVHAGVRRQHEPLGRRPLHGSGLRPRHPAHEPSAQTGRAVAADAGAGDPRGIRNHEFPDAVAMLRRAFTVKIVKRMKHSDRKITPPIFMVFILFMVKALGDTLQRADQS